MESKDDQIIEYVEKDIDLTPESIELRSLAVSSASKACYGHSNPRLPGLSTEGALSEACPSWSTDTSPTNAVPVEGIEIPIIQIDAIHVGKLFGNRFERIFINDDLVNYNVRPVFDDDRPTQTTMIVNLDSDNTIVLYRGYFRRVTVILGTMVLVFFVITVVYIMIFPPK